MKPPLNLSVRIDKGCTIATSQKGPEVPGSGSDLKRIGLISFDGVRNLCRPFLDTEKTWVTSILLESLIQKRYPEETLGGLKRHTHHEKITDRVPPLGKHG